jgi:Rrf2 family nitric oxide-sensitive transcriptional repressor
MRNRSDALSAAQQAAKDDGLATIPEVAQNYGVSKNHLVKVAHRLVQEGYITGLRGAKGGLRLAYAAETEPEMALVSCFPFVKCALSHCAGLCTARRAGKARSALLKALDGYTLPI